jgi:hypothetical protein
LLSDIAVGANLSTCLHCRNRIGHGQGKLRTAPGDRRQKQRSLRCPTYLRQNSLVCSALAIPGARRSIHPIDNTAIRP